MANQKKGTPVFGLRDAARPDILPIAETIEIPAAVDFQALGPYGRVPAQTAPLALPFWRDQGYVPSRRRTRVSRLALLAILSLQALLSLRLRNTAFEDEALYLYVGRSRSRTCCTVRRCRGATRPTSPARRCFTRCSPPRSTPSAGWRWPGR